MSNYIVKKKCFISNYFLFIFYFLTSILKIPSLYIQADIDKKKNILISDENVVKPVRNVRVPGPLNKWAEEII